MSDSLRYCGYIAAAVKSPLMTWLKIDAWMSACSLIKFRTSNNRRYCLFVCQPAENASFSITLTCFLDDVISVPPCYAAKPATGFNSLYCFSGCDGAAADIWRLAAVSCRSSRVRQMHMLPRQCWKSSVAVAWRPRATKLSFSWQSKWQCKLICGLRPLQNMSCSLIKRKMLPSLNPYKLSSRLSPAICVNLSRHTTSVMSQMITG